MKKKIVLKYLMVIFAMAISFFALSNDSVKAATVQSKIVDNLFFELEEIESGNPSVGYKIIGVVDTCGGDDTCLNSISSIENLVIPDEYNNNPVYTIDDGNFLVGVLDSLSTRVRGTISGGNNLTTIGICAFCNFTNIDEIVLAESVVLIRDYAFSSSSISILTINRYMVLHQEKVTSIESSNVFSATSLSKIVFRNNTIANYYKEVEGWKDLTNLFDKFTYRITYRFYSDTTNYSDIVYYNGLVLGSIPADMTMNGFDFVGWYSMEFSDERITSNSIAKVSTQNSSLIHVVNPRWQLSESSITIKSYYDNEEDSDNKVVYSGKDKSLDFVVEFSHVLDSESGFVVKYEWESTISGITNVVGEDRNTYSINYVKQSGTYTCYVTITYLGYSRTDNVYLIATIEARELLINVNDNETEYGTYVGPKYVDGSYFAIDASTSLASNEVVKNYTTSVYTNSNREIEVNEYNDVLSVTILSIGTEGSETNYIDNYKITYDYGDLKVNPKVMVKEVKDNFEFSYGDSESLTKQESDVVYVSETNENGITNNLVFTYSRENSSVSDADSYDIIGVSVNNTNYSVTLDEESTGKVVINPKQVSVVWSIDEDLVYDGEKKSVSALYKTIDNADISLSIEIKKNSEVSEMVNAGTYSVSATMATNDSNYSLQGDVREVVVERADSAFVGDQRQTKVYNGLPQRIDVSLNHTESTIIYGDYTSCKNAHISTIASCTINVSVGQSENYNALSSNFYLHINPYEFDVEPDLFEITYGNALTRGNLSKVYDGVNGEKVNVYFSKEGTSTGLNVGYYNVGSVDLSGNTNYRVTLVEGSGVNKIKIVPSLVQVRFFYYENLVYDGNVKNIGIRVYGTSEDVGLQVDYNGREVIKNAGKYQINLSLSNTNFAIEGNDYLQFEIKKANYDVSKLRLESKKVSYNFGNHFINLVGELPEGLSVEYTIDDNKGNGTFLPFKHIVKATFVGDFENYNYIEPMEAVLNVSMTWVWVCLGLILGIGGGCVLTLFILVKMGKLRLVKRIKRSKFRNVIKKNKEILAINEMFRNKRKELILDKEEENEFIEEPVKFVKNPVSVPQEAMLSLSFVDKLFKSEYGTKQFYSEVKNELLSYEGVVSKIKRDYETFYVNNIPVAKFNVVDGVLQTYFALDPSQYRKDEYKHENVSKEKDFVAVPLNLAVNSIESLRHAKMFVRIIRKKEGLKSVSNFIRTDYASIYTANDGSFRLFKKVFVKKGKEDKEEY